MAQGDVIQGVDADHGAVDIAGIGTVNGGLHR